MVGAQLGSAGVVDFQLHGYPRLDGAARNLAEVDEEPIGLLLRVADLDRETLAAYRAGVTHLAAGFAVEGGLVDNNGDVLASLRGVDLRTFLHQGQDYALGLLRVVAQEFGGAQLLAQRKPDRLRRGFARARPIGPGFGSLALHRIVETVQIYGNPALAQRILRKIQRKAVGVIQLEG